MGGGIPSHQIKTGGGGDGRGKHTRRSAILLPLIQFLVTADGISDAC